MKQEVLTKKRLIQEQKCPQQLIARGLFCLAGCGVTALPLIQLKQMDMNLIISMCFTGVFGFGLFGCYLGLIPLIGVVRRMQMINHDQFVLKKEKLTDKEALSRDDTSRYSYFYFGDSRIAVHELDFRKAKLGDWFYLMIYDGDEGPSTVFPTEEYSLDEELRERVI